MFCTFLKYFIRPFYARRAKHDPALHQPPPYSLAPRNARQQNACADSHATQVHACGLEAGQLRAGVGEHGTPPSQNPATGYPRQRAAGTPNRVGHGWQRRSVRLTRWSPASNSCYHSNTLFPRARILHAIRAPPTLGCSRRNSSIVCYVSCGLFWLHQHTAVEPAAAAASALNTMSASPLLARPLPPRLVSCGPPFPRPHQCSTSMCAAAADAACLLPSQSQAHTAPSSGRWSTFTARETCCTCCT